MSKEIHFVHTTDWHLGFLQYNKEERFKDYARAANQGIEKIIRLKPQFVLHTGDIFHHSRPNPGALRQAVIILKKLKEANIPIYSIRGNHDGLSSARLQKGGTVIQLLHDLGLITYVHDKIISHDYAKILGVGYYTGNSASRRLLEILEANPDFISEEHFNIVGLHAYAEGQIPDLSQIRTDTLDSLKADYVALGHFHVPWDKPSIRSWAPGSTEATSVNDWNLDDNNMSLHSFIYEVKATYDEKWSKPEIIKHQIPVRPKVVIDIQSKAKDAEDLENEVIQKLKEKYDEVKRITNLDDPQPIAKVDVKSDLGPDELTRFSKAYVSEQVKYLDIRFSIEGKETVTTLDFADHSLASIEEMILELSGLEGDDAQVFLGQAIEILNAFGEIPEGRALDPDKFKSIVSLFAENSKGELVDKKHEPQSENNQAEEEPESAGLEEYI